MAAIDDFNGKSKSMIDAPYTKAEVVTPSDTVDLTNVSRALYVGVAGDVVAITATGQTVTFKAMPVGFHRVRLSRVKATSTTATNMLSMS